MLPDSPREWDVREREEGGEWVKIATVKASTVAEDKASKLLLIQILQNLGMHFEVGVHYHQRLDENRYYIWKKE